MSVAIVGGGRIGSAIHKMLHGMVSSRVYDSDASRGIMLDCSDHESLRGALSGMDTKTVVCAAPFGVGAAVATAAAETGCHYVDMTEDVGVAAEVKRLAADAHESSFVPQSGLAPGFVGIVGTDMLSKFDKPVSLRMRVGALPQSITGGLRYDCTWSADGLINEYSNPCKVVSEGRQILVEPLDGVEMVTIDGVEYEAFNTSGGAGDLPEYAWDLEELNYKTLRYPGHRDLMVTLMRELRIDRDHLVEAFRKLPNTLQDVVVIHVEATGYYKGELQRASYTKKIRPCAKLELNAIQMSTAGSVCAIVELIDSLPRGYVSARDVSLSDFLSTRWGAVYA